MAGPMGYPAALQPEDSPRSSLHGYQHPIAGQGPSAGGSEYNVSVAGSTSRQQAGFERRLAWLEEDVAVLQKRLRDDVENGAGGRKGAPSEGGRHDADELRTLVAQLDSELAAEQRLREAMEARLSSFEEVLREERLEREAHLRSFSQELETTIGALISRIDESLVSTTPSKPADATELRIRSLIQRVDEGLSAGAAALQDTLTAAGAALEPEEFNECVALASQRLRSPRSPTRHREVLPHCAEDSFEPGYLAEQAIGTAGQE